MNKDLWDKINVIATIVQIVVIGGFTAVVSLYTARMTNKLNTYKAGMDENNMIKTLVMDLTSDTSGNVKTDFALLSLERYLKSSNADSLHPYDRDMLVGFAQSVILDRVRHLGKNANGNINEILIPKELLQKYDTLRLDTIISLISRNSTKTILPVSVTSNTLENAQPVNQITEGNVQIMNAILSKIVYIQYSNPQNRSSAEQIRQLFTGTQWRAPGCELVKGDFSNSIRYFHSEDSSLAEEIRDLLKTKTGKDFQVLPVKGFDSKVPKGQLEVWYGK